MHGAFSQAWQVRSPSPTSYILIAIAIKWDLKEHCQRFKSKSLDIRSTLSVKESCLDSIVPPNDLK